MHFFQGRRLNIKFLKTTTSTDAHVYGVCAEQKDLTVGVPKRASLQQSEPASQLTVLHLVELVLPPAAGMSYKLVRSAACQRRGTWSVQQAPKNLTTWQTTFSVADCSWTAEMNHSFPHEQPAYNGALSQPWGYWSSPWPWWFRLPRSAGVAPFQKCVWEFLFLLLPTDTSFFCLFSTAGKGGGFCHGGNGFQLFSSCVIMVEQHDQVVLSQYVRWKDAECWCGMLMWNVVYYTDTTREPRTVLNHGFVLSSCSTIRLSASLLAVFLFLPSTESALMLGWWPFPTGKSRNRCLEDS